MREYPQAEGEPYYPVPRPENEALFKRYEALAREERDVTFVGRLAQYRYYNMDQCVGAALRAAEYVLEKMGQPSSDTPPQVTGKPMSTGVGDPLIAKR